MCSENTGYSRFPERDHHGHRALRNPFQSVLGLRGREGSSLQHVVVEIAYLMHLSSASPRGGGPRAMCGKIGDFVGTLQRILAALVGEIWGL